MEDSPDSQENGLDSEKSTSEGAPVKINKHRSKVWDKVSWFRRKNRTNEEDSITQQFIISNTEEENEHPFILGAALNPVLCKSSASNLSDCSLSSDEGDYSCLSDINDLNGNPIMPIAHSPSPEELSRTSADFCHGFKETSKVTCRSSFIDEENQLSREKWEITGCNSSSYHSLNQCNRMKNANLINGHKITKSSNEDEESADISFNEIFQNSWDTNQQICETYRGLSGFKVFNDESNTCFASNKDLQDKGDFEEATSVVDALFEPNVISTCNIQLRQNSSGGNRSEVRKSYSLPHHYKHGGGGDTNEINAITKCQQKRRHLAWGKELFKMKSTSLTWICSCPEPSTYKDEPLMLTSYSSPEKCVNPSEFKTRLKTVEKWFTECNEEQKNLMLKMLLEHCDTAQNHLLSVSLEPILHHLCPPNCQDLLSWLPSHLTLYILSFLDAVSLAQCSRACRSWYSLANEPCLWQRFCKDPTWQLSPSADKKQLESWKGQDGHVQWKKAFSERFRLRRNWLKGYCHVRTFEGHTQGISCVQFDDTRIVSGSSDKTIKVWNIRTNSQWSVMTLVGHSGTVRCLHLEGSRLVSGSTDRTIKVWDLSSQHSWSSIACKVTMIGHTDTVRCLQVDDEKVVSGSYDRTLKVWDIRTGHCRLTLQSHEAAVLCLQFDNQKIVSGSCDNTIKIWNLEAGVCVDTLHGHQDAVTCLQFNDSRILSGSLDRTIKFWSLQTGQCLRTLDWMKSEGHTGVIRCLQADSWRFVSGGDDKSLKVWSLETGQRLVTLRNHTDGVTCLQFNDNIIVSGSYDKTVKLWDFSVC